MIGRRVKPLDEAMKSLCAWTDENSYQTIKNQKLWNCHRKLKFKQILKEKTNNLFTFESQIDEFRNVINHVNYYKSQ